MSLREIVNELNRSRKIIRPPQLPARLKIEKSYNQVTAKYDQVSFVKIVDYHALLTKLNAVANSGSIKDLTYREMRLAASCLFDGHPRLADNKLFLDLFLDALRSLRSRLAIKRLIYSYCLHFNPTDRGIQRIGEFLREAILHIEGHWDWPERHRKYRFFDPVQAPQQLASLTAESTNPRKELERIGLGGQLLASGLSVHTYLNALNIIQKRLRSNPNLQDVDRAITWAQADDGTLLFSAQRGDLANALLLPFSLQDPNHEIHQRIQNYFLESLSDPRIDKAAWIGAAEPAIDVMIRWLAQATLEQFLKVVDRVAAKQQWDYRRAFWGAYIEKRVVTNSWVAFGSDGARVAKQISDRTTDKIMRRFATLEGAGADQAVLLLRIGELVVADWSHNGRLRIWRRGNTSAPEFNNNHYIAKTLRTNSDFDTVHIPPDGWQARAEAYIRRHTNIKLVESDYMPRRRTK